MKSAIFTLAVATAFGGTVVAGLAQDMPKAAAGPIAGDSRQMPVAGSDAAKAAQNPETLASGTARMGKVGGAKLGDAQPNTLIEAKASKE